MISLIAVIGKNNELGCDGKLLWNIPADLKRFRDLTLGYPVIMGRKTFESIGKPLPGRQNIVISRNANYDNHCVYVAHSLEEAIKLGKHYSDKEIFVIGGGEIYKQSLSLADKLYLTIVDDNPKADTFFPDYSEFKNIVYEKTHEMDDLKYTFMEITR